MDTIIICLEADSADIDYFCDGLEVLKQTDGIAHVKL